MLVGLAVTSVIIAIAGVWQVPFIDHLAESWFGRSSMRWRIAGVIVVLGGGMLLPALPIAVAIKRALVGLRRRG